MKTKYFFLILAVVIFSCFVAGCSNKNDILNNVTVEEFNKTPDKSDELFFFVKNKRIAEGKLHHVYKYKVSFWDNMFSPTKYLNKYPEDIAIATNAGDGSTYITILTDYFPTHKTLHDGRHP